MSDNLEETGTQNDIRINVMEQSEVTYWSNELGVSAQKLKEAVKAVGPMVENVKKYLTR